MRQRETPHGAWNGQWEETSTLELEKKRRAVGRMKSYSPEQLAKEFREFSRDFNLEWKNRALNLFAQAA
jgi:hypothetical protein